MTNNFKKGLDRMMWVQTSPSPTTHAVGMSVCSDLRNDISRNPFVYQITTNTNMNRYNIVTKSWSSITLTTLSGTFGAGAGCVFAPSLAKGMVGAIGTGSTTTSVVVASGIFATLFPNQLANRGGSGDYGYRIRIIGKSSGGSGKTEERWIVANTSGTTPTIYLDSALTFTPASGDGFEILSGVVYRLGAGTMASSSWRGFEVGGNYDFAGGTTNLPALINTDFSAIALDEQYVPYTRKIGEGFLVGAGTYDGATKNCLTATATASGTLTGQSSGGDFGVLTNEYRNFQIRIVEDTAIPTAVGQRRMIASHTGGTLGSYVTPVYTLGTAWTVTPSSTAKYVIEYPNFIFLRSAGSNIIYLYNYTNATINNGTNSINSESWNPTFFSLAGSPMGAGCTTFASFGIVPDVAKQSRHSYIYCFRGGGSSALDLFDLAGGTTGAWSNAITYDGTHATTINTGSCGKYSPFDNEGRFGYLNIYSASAVNQLFRFDVKNRVLTPFTSTGWVQSGTAVVGDRLSSTCLIDGSDKYSLLFLNAHTATNCFECVVQI